MVYTLGPGSLLTVCMYVKSLQTLCDPMDCSPPVSSVHGILQTRILEWVAMPSSRRSSQPRDRTRLLCLLHWQVGFLALAPPGKFQWSVQFSSVAQSSPTLCDPMNRSTPGLPVHHQLPEFTQTHVHRWNHLVIPSSHLILSSPSLPAPNPSQHQSLFQ